MEDNRQVSNGEAFAGLILFGCAVYGACKLTQFAVGAAIDGSVWIGKKFINACKKNKKK